MPKRSPRVREEYVKGVLSRKDFCCLFFIKLAKYLAGQYVLLLGVIFSFFVPYKCVIVEQFSGNLLASKFYTCEQDDCIIAISSRLMSGTIVIFIFTNILPLCYFYLVIFVTLFFVYLIICSYYALI